MAVDLGELEGNKFLVIEDVASNFCQAVWVKSKQPSEIVEKIIENGYLFLGLWDKFFLTMGLNFRMRI